MGQSYRLRTEIGTNKTINVQLDQDFEFLEILSLKLRQVDVYNRDCSNYGVLVGRVTANNGFGIPNAKVSVFIPIQPIDESNPIITSIYPYKSPEDKNEDGYRYNLLPYEKSYSTHAATGSFPSLDDTLSDNTAIEIYDKYYKLTSKTNDSGDYMIMGAPLGVQTIVMDVDLSDIGEFSLSPQDLIRMGIATESQVGGNTFKTSTDLNSLPQIISINKSIDISPLWGDQDICQVAINRLDFDLRDDANVDIRPTSVFMGSMFSSPEKMRVRAGFKFLGLPILSSSKPKDNLGNLCNLVAGPGQILCVRQTINQDEYGNPILEEYRLEQSGNVIDGDGTWLIEVPMNLDYIITNEFGEKVISLDPTIGIPTKGKYRFKIKWQQSPSLTDTNRRAYFLVPNVKEYGWSSLDCDPNIEYGPTDGCYTYYNSPSGKIEKDRLKSSYYFGLDWSGYTQGFFNTTQENGLDNRLNEIIDCEDTFYEFKYNKVYTVSSLIDQWKRGGRGRFIGIKEIDDDECSSTINKFPVNEGFQNFDFLFFLFSILMTTLSFVFIYLLIIAHIILFLYYIIIKALCILCYEVEILNYKPFAGLCTALGIDCSIDRFTIRLPMITYPECSTCECKTGDLTKENVGGGTTGVLSYVSFPASYVRLISEYVEDNSKPPGDKEFPQNNTVIEYATILAQALSGNDDTNPKKFKFKTPKSDELRVRAWDSDDDDDDGTDAGYASSDDLPLGERINIFNGRSSYFSGLNKIRVSFDSKNNPNTHHFDNAIVVLANQSYNVGDLLTTVNPETSGDVNFIFTAETTSGVTRGIEGVGVSGPNTITVDYANSPYVNNTVTYNLSTGTTVNRQIYPSDREYFQVLTAITVSQALEIWKNITPPIQSFPNVLTAKSLLKLYVRDTLVFGYKRVATFSFSPIEYFEGIDNQYVLILQRGVDPYSPKLENKYGVGKLFGFNNENDIIITGSTRLNIPIQKITNNTISVQNFNKDEMYYKSYFFTPGNLYSGFTSETVSFYGRLDAKNLSIYGSVTGTSNVLLSDPGNGLYSDNKSPSKYDKSEDLSGGAIMLIEQENDFRDTITNYFTPVIYFYENQRTLTFPVSTKDYNVLRTDRLPSSDVINGSTWEYAAMLQQNNNFKFYSFVEGDNTTIPTYTTGAQQTRPDIEGQPGATRVLESFDCEKMVSLKCYEGFGDEFRVNQKCTEKDNVERGCYLLLRRPGIDLFNGKDFKTYGEWVLRFRFFYGLCRGVLSQSFTNNWINGSLFAFPIQVNTFYDKQNKPFSTFPEELIHYDKGTTNFYYRSSPYDLTIKKFVGKKSEPSGIFNLSTAVNEKNLLFPTTIMDLGMKEKFYSEIIYEPYSRGYVLSNLNPTSYSDMSDIVNLFVISRITDAKFFDAIIPLGDNSIVELFTRNTESGNFFEKNAKRRIDGDFAQTVSINSEVGLINFSPEFYETPPCDNEWCKTHDCKYVITNDDDNNIMTVTYEDVNGIIISFGLTPGQTSSEIISKSFDSFIFIVNGNPSDKYTLVNNGCAKNESPTRVLGSQRNPTIAIWFSSTTENLQTKDFITPGTINFRTNDLQFNFPFKYGIKSQKVPFYPWRVKPATNNLFGTQYNNWITDKFYVERYQSLDRRNPPPDSYFMSDTIPATTDRDLYQRGYIFSVDANGDYSKIGSFSDEFLVGAPFQFYFGIIRGDSALDKFKKKYLADE
jgi:hypothetical protein